MFLKLHQYSLCPLYAKNHYIHEAKMCGAIVELPCINKSDHANTVKGKTIYLGYGYLKNLEHLLIQRILTERQLYGNFLSLDDFINRVTISIEQLTVLIRITAFRFTNKPKTALLWQATFKLSGTKKPTEQEQGKLFRVQNQHFEIPKLNTHWLENVYDEIELLGFTIHDYFSLLTDKLCPHSKAKNMTEFSNKNVLLYGLLVTTRFNKISQGKLMLLSAFYKCRTPISNKRNGNLCVLWQDY